MDIGALLEMFPSLTRTQIEGLQRTHRTEDALVTACMELEEKQGGVAKAGVPEPKVTLPVVAPPKFESRSPKVNVPRCAPRLFRSFVFCSGLNRVG